MKIDEERWEAAGECLSKLYEWKGNRRKGLDLLRDLLVDARMVHTAYQSEQLERVTMQAKAARFAQDRENLETQVRSRDATIAALHANVTLLERLVLKALNRQ
jgi:hypothetical protein